MSLEFLCRHAHAILHVEGHRAVAATIKSADYLAVMVMVFDPPSRSDKYDTIIINKREEVAVLASDPGTGPGALG